MDEFKLKRIPMFDYPNCDYETYKNIIYRFFNEMHSEGCTVIESVNGTYYHKIDTTMDENGMDKFTAMLFGMLFMIENNEVEADQAYGTYYDIVDFETGEYDDLFTAEDLILIKKDIEVIKNYIAKHPELIKD